jgi:hypothetical protein
VSPCFSTKGSGAKGVSASEKTTGPEPGPPPPWGVEKVLWRLMCIGIDAEVAGANAADDRVEIGAVAINEATGGMNGFGDRRHVRLEQAAGVGVGDHHRRHVRPKPRLQRIEVDPAAVVGRDALNR